MSEDYSKLKRPKQSVPGFVKQALKSRGLSEAYKKRPEYQQDDYLSWINEAKLQETRKERLSQMLDELEKGGIYMKKDYPGSKK